jgi:hypothetical protein
MSKSFDFEKIDKSIGIDTSTVMTIDAVFVSDHGPASARERRPYAEINPVDQMKRIFTPKIQRFRIQFVGAAPDRGPATLKEVEIQASDVSAAIVTVTNMTWPPQAIGLRILDREGHEIFARQKADRG